MMMKLRSVLALMLSLAFMSAAHAQVTNGTTPLTGQKGGTGNAFMQFTGPASSLKTYTLPNSNSTLAAINQIQTWTGAQSFTDSDLILLGSSSGSVTLHAPATGGASATFFSGTDTVAGIASVQTLTNKTITSSTDTLGGVTMGLGSDATGDIYYNNGGVLARLGIGSATNILTVSGGKPAWVAATGGGNVSNTGTPTVNQLALWTNSTTIEGVTATAHAIVVGEGASAPNYVGPGTVGQFDAAQGASSDPSFVSGPWTLLASPTVTNAANLQDTTHFTSTYNHYQIEITNCLAITTGGQQLELQFFITGTLQTTGYTTAAATIGSGAVSATNPTTFIPLSQSGAVLTTGVGAKATINFDFPSVTTAPKNAVYSGTTFGGSVNNSIFGGGQYNAGNGAITGVNIQMGTGNLTCRADIYARL